MASSYVRSGHKLSDLRLNVSAAQGRVCFFIVYTPNPVRQSAIKRVNRSSMICQLPHRGWYMMIGGWLPGWLIAGKVSTSVSSVCALECEVLHSSDDIIRWQLLETIEVKKIMWDQANICNHFWLNPSIFFVKPRLHHTKYLRYFKYEYKLIFF